MRLQLVGTALANDPDVARSALALRVGVACAIRGRPFRLEGASVAVTSLAYAHREADRRKLEIVAPQHTGPRDDEREGTPVSEPSADVNASLPRTRPTFAALELSV